MNIHKSPENYVFYNGVTMTNTIYCNGDVPANWLLVKVDKQTIDTIVDDGQTPEWWNNIQQNGERFDYSYAFCNSGYAVLKPIHPIKATNVMYMFMGCNVLENASNILIHITSEKPNMMYVCANCNSMKKPPLFNFLNVPIVKTYISMYAGCYSLECASVYWGDGTADPVTERSSCQNMFFKCWKVKDLDFGKENTGSPTNLDLSYCKDLTSDSVDSLQKSLLTIPEGSYGTYEITLATKTVENLTANYPEILEGFTAKGWTIKSVTREESEDE